MCGRYAQTLENLANNGKIVIDIRTDKFMQEIMKEKSSVFSLLEDVTNTS